MKQKNIKNGTIANDKRAHDNSVDRDGRIYDRDYCRVLYSNAFRRLQGKMQLLGIDNTKFYRNRLTHSLEVAQIARSIAQNKYKYPAEDLYVVEAGALAHDIGNPPFGHSGERKLNELFDDVGGFEGNAQSLRILTTLENKFPNFGGLDLRFRTLLSVVKYFKKRKQNGNICKKFIYDEDYNLISNFISKNNIKVRTLDVQIVDVADEIAYAAHDIEDGLRNGGFTIQEILIECKRQIDFKNKILFGAYKKFCNIVISIEKDLSKMKNLSSAMYSKQFAQNLQSEIIKLLISDIDYVIINDDIKDITGSNNDREIRLNKFEEFASLFKKVVFDCINNKNSVRLYELKGNKVLEYLNDFYQKNIDLLPPEYRSNEVFNIHKPNCNENIYQRRLICDYLSGMTESFAIKQYEEISGKSFDAIMGN